MVILSHPFGNQNVRQALAALNGAGLLEGFHTTVFWDSAWAINSLIPRAIRNELNRRTYPQVQRRQVRISPFRESGRLLLTQLGARRHARLFSTAAINNGLDARTAKHVETRRPRAVYAYPSGALRSFRAAKKNGAICVYELPSAYWRFNHLLLQEEAARRPEYADTIQGYSQYQNLFCAWDEELSLADHIIVPSNHVKQSLKSSPIYDRTIHLVPYGANDTDQPAQSGGRRPATAKLRVLFVGSLSQLKGIGYLIDAVKTMAGAVDLTLLGRKTGKSRCIDEAVKEHRWIPSAPHHEVLEIMANHDVLVLPSLTEGLALVLGEAMSMGLPVIATPSSGAPEIIRDKIDGFLVPIRCAESISEKLELLHKDRDLLENMSRSAFHRSRELTWNRYRNLLLEKMTAIMRAG